VAVAAEEETESILGDLLQLAASAGGDEGVELAARVDTDFGKISPEDLSDLQMAIAKDGGPDDAVSPARAVADAIQSAVDKRMVTARADIEELISNTGGDINAGIRKCLKKQDNPLPLLMVLQLNIQQAQTVGEEDKLRALMHVYTVMNEELEKKVSRVRALLNKLMRMDDESIRANLLRHHLTPVEVAAAPDPLTEGDGEGRPPLMASLVTPDRLAAAISKLVGDTDRQMRAAVGDSDEARFEITDRIRVIAKEARLMIGEIYGEGEMNTFGAELTPAFHTLMSHKAKQQPAAVPEPEQARE